MKFQSRKDILFFILVFGTISLLVWSAVEIFMNFDWLSLIVFVIVLLTIVLLLWIYFGTSYEINQENFSYKSGPLKGKIAINRITEITKGKTKWSGIKPATAQKGLIVKYDKYNEIYISPKTNESFINELLKLNDEIRITE